MRDGIRAQGHSEVCRGGMQELLQGSAKGQQRLEQVERRTRDTAVQIPATPLHGVMLQVVPMSLQEVPLKMRLKTP